MEKEKHLWTKLRGARGGGGGRTGSQGRGFWRWVAPIIAPRTLHSLPGAHALGLFHAALPGLISHLPELLG